MRSCNAKRKIINSSNNFNSACLAHLNKFMEIAVPKRTGFAVSRARFDRVDAKVSNRIARTKQAQLFVFEAATSSRILLATVVMVAKPAVPPPRSDRILRLKGFTRLPMVPTTEALELKSGEAIADCADRWDRAGNKFVDFEATLIGVETGDGLALP